jgi:cell division protein FtsB
MPTTIERLIAQLGEGLDQLKSQLAELAAEHQHLVAQRESLEEQVMTLAIDPYAPLRHKIIRLAGEGDDFPDHVA